MKTLTAAVLGASGYVGGELTRLLLGHAGFDLKYVTSESNAGKPLGKIHPNLRGATTLKFVKLADVEKVDVIFSCLPHGTLAPQYEQISQLGAKIIDCSADFRLADSAAYEKWYGAAHPKPELLKDFVCGIPELHSAKLKKAAKIAIAGCTATAAILALAPLVQAKLIDLEKIVLDIKTGSSGSGNKPNIGSHHPERAGIIRSYKLAGHRHTGEVVSQLGLSTIPGYSVTSVPTVRGIVCHAHTFPVKDLTNKDLWQLYRDFYGKQPFVRLVAEPSGPHALPEPKILSGTNYCDIGWVLDKNSGQLVIVTALDNLMKGAAGQAIQAANLACGFDETTGLEFLGLHPAN